MTKIINALFAGSVVACTQLGTIPHEVVETSKAVTEVMFEPSDEEVIEIDFESLDISGEMMKNIRYEADDEARYYDMTVIQSPVLPVNDMQTYRTVVEGFLASGKYTLERQYEYRDRHFPMHRTNTHRTEMTPEDIAKLDWAQIYALYISLTMHRLDDEKDLRLRGDSGETRIVSVYHDPNNSLVVTSSKQWEPLYPSVKPEIFRARYRLGSLDSGSKPWTDTELSVLADALKVLEPTELRYLVDLSFVRERKSDNGLAANYHYHSSSDQGLHQSITVYDTTFVGQEYRFCGNLERTYSAAHMTIVHELGHLIADQPLLEHERLLNETVREHNRLVQVFNDTQSEGVLLELNAVKAELEELRRKKFSAVGPIVDAFLESRSAAKGPTVYADTNSVEAFAESYALFKLDPKALNRADPGAFEWFESKQWLELLPK